jgi:hypothetical protein
VNAAAPDYLEPVVGWRMWYAVDDGAATSLSSVVQKTLWPRGEPLAAVCLGFHLRLWPLRRRTHDAPAADCRCGVHAANIATLRMYLPERFARTDLVPVFGRVSLWGVVHEHEQGWRGELAYPQCLFLPVDVLRPARARRMLSDLRAYGVPVRAVAGSGAEAVIGEISELAA